ncbi:MAG: DUF2911 domain-containing protein [Planctomycetes bacterium]|nr:DUF2911 domain-containing protein [Planctomycetota bacterium]
MRIPFLPAALAALCFALPASAQKVEVFGGSGTRAASTQVLFGDGIMAGMSISYGQPVWQDSYDALTDQAKGRLLRLGKDWWTLFTTSVDVAIGGTKIPAGAYVAGLQCDKDGKWNLALLEATKAMKQGATPWPIDEEGTMNWKPDLLAPLQLQKGANKEPIEKLTITLAANGEDLQKGTFTIAWGKHQLTAPLAVAAAKK